MKFILVDTKSGKSRSLSANGLLLGVAIASLLGLPAAVGYMGYRAGLEEAEVTSDLVAKWREALAEDAREIDLTKQEARASLEASALRLAQLQARIIRLDALGERLITIANLDEGEFNFSQAPALGGPESGDTGSPLRPGDFMQALDVLTDEIENRDYQLSVLETLLVDRKMQKELFLAGRPVEKGWISSRFGKRSDPINGRLAWHNGVDFAGKEGSEVVTVASGVVVFAGTRSGYGEMVEINHGGGFTSRYGHHKRLLVKVGDVVKKGQIIGLMGNSGRSTGPHVHFEVYKNGRVVDPASYIHRAAR